MEAGSTGRIRVLTLIDYVQRHGGAERLALEVNLHLDQRAFEPVVCATRAISSDAESALREAGVRALCLHRKTRSSARAWTPFLRELRAKGIDIVHSHKFGSNAWGALFSTALRVPVFIAHEHTWGVVRNPFERLVERQVQRRSTVMLTVADSLRREMVADGFDANKLRVFRHGIAGRAAEPSSDTRTELGISPGDLVIGTVAVLRPEKRLERLVTVAASLTRTFPRLRVIVVGDGPERRHLEAQARQAGVADAFMFLGMRDDARSIFGALDVAVFTSEREGRPLAVMEALAAGTPVVTTNVGDVGQIVRDGVDGFLIEPDDVAGLVDRVAYLLSERDVARAMGAAARVHADAAFALRASVADLEDLYRELVRGSSTNGG